MTNTKTGSGNKGLVLNIIRESDVEFRVKTNMLLTQPLNMKELFKTMMFLEVPFEEVELAVTELVKNNHQRANFGIDGRFIFSM